MSTRTMKEGDDELLEVTCDWPLSCLEGLAIFHVASRSGNKTEITHGSYADLYKMCVYTFRWNKKMEKHHNKNKEKMHQRDLLQQTYCGHSLQYILLSWDIIVCLTLWCLPIGIATFRQHTSSLPQLIKETESKWTILSYDWLICCWNFPIHIGNINTTKLYYTIFISKYNLFTNKNVYLTFAFAWGWLIRR